VHTVLTVSTRAVLAVSLVAVDSAYTSK
jgi:hypothetical protein